MKEKYEKNYKYKYAYKYKVAHQQRPRRIIPPFGNQKIGNQKRNPSDLCTGNCAVTSQYNGVAIAHLESSNQPKTGQLTLSFRVCQNNPPQDNSLQCMFTYQNGRARSSRSPLTFSTTSEAFTFYSCTDSNDIQTILSRGTGKTSTSTSTDQETSFEVNINTLPTHGHILSLSVLDDQNKSLFYSEIPVTIHMARPGRLELPTF
jgi:hypothetical protein